jgi:hypothetical protein
MREVAGPFRPHLGPEMAMSSLLVVRSSARHQRRTQLPFLQSVLGESESIHSRTQACGECAFGAAGCEALGSGSTCRWRRSAVVRIPAFRAGDSRTPAFRAGDRDGRKAATRVGRHLQRSERLNAWSAEAAAGGASAANVTSSMVPNYRGGQIVTGLSQAARNMVGPGEMR